MDHIDIHGPVKALCDALDLPYEQVARIEITPNRVHAKVYLKDGDSFRIEPLTGTVAYEMRSFQVLT